MGITIIVEIDLAFRIKLAVPFQVKGLALHEAFG
jgi:hypothetical protein